VILVTGGSGSIGASTAPAITDLGEHVVVTRHRKAAPPSFPRGAWPSSKPS
jgi:uncharacterized protein YbjT (DUF2867 family)